MEGRAAHKHKLKRVRGAYSQTALAALACVSQSYISRFENGNASGMSPDAVLRIVKVYELLEKLNETSSAEQ